MKIKVFEPNRYGKIEFTRAELEKLLNEVYTDGYKEGVHDARSHSWTWTSPYYASTITAINTNATNTNNAAIDTLNSKVATCNYSDDSTPLQADGKTCIANAANETTTYTVTANGSIIGVDLSKLANDISTSDSKKIGDAFDKLAKELNF